MSGHSILKSRLGLSLLAVLLLSCLQAQAQMARLYSSSSRLPSTSVNSIYQDVGGYIWVCSESGLVRYDGNDVLSFQSESKDSLSLRSDQVTQVLQDIRGQFWVASASALQILDPEKGHFHTVELQPGSPPNVRFHVSSLAEVPIDEERSLLYVGVSGRGLFIIDTRTRQLDPEATEAIPPEARSEAEFVFKDSRNRVWILFESGGFAVSDGTTTRMYEEFSWAPNLAARKRSIRIRNMAEARPSGKILMCTAEDGLLMYDPQSDRIRRVKDATSEATHSNVAIFTEGGFLVGTENFGIKEVDVDTETCTDATFPNLPFNISSWKIHSLCEDNQGNIWVGTYLSGILVIPRPTYGFTYRSFSKTGALGDNTGCVSCIVRGQDGTLWVGTDGSGLFRVGTDGKTVHFDTENSRLGSNSILSLCIDKRGKLWVSTYEDGLNTFTPAQGFRPILDAKSFPSKQASYIQYDEKRDHLYVGTFGAGFAVVDAQTERVLQTFSNGNIRYTSALCYDPVDDQLWVGGSYVLFQYDPALGELNPLMVDNIRVLEERVSCIAKRGPELWVGTSKGLVCYRVDTGEVRVFTAEDGLSSNQTQGILLCDNGDVWVSTSHGLNLLEGGRGPIVKYYDFDGLQGNQFYRGSAYGDRDGNVYFGGVGGLTSFLASEFRRGNHPMPDISLSQFSIMGEPADLVTDKRGAETLVVPPDRRYFTIAFSVPEYTNPRKVEFAYFMEGFDQKWRGAGRAHSVSYTRLRPGRYTFRVKASFEGEPDNYSTCSLPVIVKSPWYMRWWAILGFGAILLFATYFILRFFRERTQHQIQDLKLRTVANLAHDIRTPIGLVSSPLKKLRDQTPEGELRETYNLMLKNCHRVNSIISQLIDVRRLDEGNIAFHFSKVDLIPVIRDAVDAFGMQARENHVKLEFRHGKKSPDTWIDPAHFDKIVYNLLSNALKYTPDGGNITVTLKGPEANAGILPGDIQEICTLSVFNSGSQVSSRDLPRLFDRYYRASNAKEGTGIGLNLSKTLAEAHYGILEAENRPDGMLFKLTLPCGNTHLPPEQTQDSHGILPKKVRQTQAAENGDRKRIVFVDDDDELCRYVLAELSGKYEVDVFNSGEPAWKHIMKTTPDLVVTDLMMPGITGDELCRRIKENPDTRLTSVIILSARTDEEQQTDAIKSGAARYLAKPISMDLLESSIAQLLTEKDAYKKSSSDSIVFDFSSVRMNSASDSLVANVLDAIKRNYENSEYSVDRLSLDVGISRVHLNRRLQAIMHVSPSALIREIRLRQAAYLLCSHEVSVSEVAYKVGFSSQTYFSTSFKERFGMTPKEFIAHYADPAGSDKLNELFRFPLDA